MRQLGGAVEDHVGRPMGEQRVPIRRTADVALHGVQVLMLEFKRMQVDAEHPPALVEQALNEQPAEKARPSGDHGCAHEVS